MTAPTKPWHPLAAVDVANWDHTADVVVVGFGIAGAAAALEAAKGGRSVILLERASAGGGSSAESGGEIYLGGGTATQKAAGFDDTPQAMKAFLMEAMGTGADEAKITAYAEGSVELHDWLVEEIGADFKPSVWETPTWLPPSDDGLMWMGEASWPYRDLAEPAPRGHRLRVGHWGGKLLMQKMGEAIERAGVTVHTDTRALRLVVDGDRVVGVAARHFNDPVTYRAERGVVITTGGFIDNEAMLRQHAPILVGHEKTTDGGDDGSGILMAQAIGAGVSRMSIGQAAVIAVPWVMCNGMIVNRLGQRFINEDTYPGQIGLAALYKQGLGVWVIVDEEGFEAVPEAERWGIRPDHVCETVAELEAECGMPEGSLQATVANYNRHAANGEDPQFHKQAKYLRELKAPFAAFDVRRGFAAPGSDESYKSTGVSVFTTGGLTTDLDSRVLDLAGEPIEGLFAAGRASSGIHSGGYISGTSLGDGAFFGRRAGQYLAAEH